MLSLRETAIAEYHELLAADETLTSATFQKLRSGMRKSRLLYGDRPIGIALRPHLLDQKQFRALTLSAERFVVWETILFEAKAVEKLTDSHIKQVLEYLAASRLRVGLLVNFGGDALEWKPVIL
jgi:hypothetical protein